MVLAGRVGGPHGLDGSFRVTQPIPELLGNGAVVTIAGRVYAINRRAGHDRGVILRLTDVADRDAAVALRGQDMWVDRSLAPELGEDEWWAEELEGCRVVDGEVDVGVVDALVALPSCEVLEVRRASGGQPLLVPLVGDAVRNVDVAAKLIDVDLTFLGEDRPGVGGDPMRSTPAAS